MQKALHLFGRYGITIFALSGLDIALWDLAAKAGGKAAGGAAGRPGADGDRRYASLFRLHDPEVVAMQTREALAEGYRCIKLHETQEPEVKAAREGRWFRRADHGGHQLSPGRRRRRGRTRSASSHTISIGSRSRSFRRRIFRALAALGAETGIPIAAGENACTAHEFEKMFAAGAVTYAQPSVTKVGGITEFRKVAALARRGDRADAALALFRAGLSRHASSRGGAGHPNLVERFYLKLEAKLYGDLIDPVRGKFACQRVQDWAARPDPDVIEAYRVPDAG